VGECRTRFELDAANARGAAVPEEEAAQDLRSRERRIHSNRSEPWTQIGRAALQPLEPFELRDLP
jgi:hypothetical protein